MSFHYQRRYTGSLRAVVFDWAGTTVDFGSRAPVAAVMEAFRRSDMPITLATARAPMGMAKRDHLEAVLRSPEVSERWHQSFGRPPHDADVEELYQRFLPLQKEILTAHAELIPGCRETIEHCRSLGMRIGSSTGYTQELMDVLVPLAREQGYAPDAVVCASDVAVGRPAPWLCFENARRLDVYPMEAIVKVDDTVLGIEAGLNAGMWTVGITKSGNLVGLSEQEWDQLASSQQQSLLASATQQMQACGAHWVMESIAELPDVLAAINERLRQGQRP